mgnify:CR=1 FL=1
MWERENTRLAYEWAVSSLETDEPDLPEYTRSMEKRDRKLKKKGMLMRFIYEEERFFKLRVSYLFLILMFSRQQNIYLFNQ